MMKTKVWTLPTRFFHWYVTTGVVAAYTLSDNRRLHIAIGSSIGVMLLFRLVWGIVGPRYSLFRDFPISLRTIRYFILNRREEGEKYIGHNPLAAFVMLLMILDGIAVVITGIATALSESDFSGAILIPNTHDVRGIHELLVNILVVLVLLHLNGLVGDWLFNKSTPVVHSMFTGYKSKKGIEAKLTTGQKVLAWAGGVSTLATLAYLLIA